MRDSFKLEQRIRTIHSFFVSADVERLSKANLGRYQLHDVKGRLSQVDSELRLIADFKQTLSMRLLTQLADAYSAFQRELENAASVGDDTFIPQRASWEDRLDAAWDQTRDAWLEVAGVAAHLRLRDFDESTTDARVEASREAALQNILEVGAREAESAREAGRRIIEDIQKASQGVSIQSAQDQFNTASKSLWKKAIYWGLGCIAAFTAFLWYAYWVSVHPPRSLEADKVSLAEIAYFGLIRPSVLTALGALINFGLKMFRAHLHMSEVNEHRRRIANSMASFVNSAHTPKHRDLIFARLVDNVVEFGDSGLLTKETEAPTVSSNLIEAIGKSLGSK